MDRESSGSLDPTPRASGNYGTAEIGRNSLPQRNTRQLAVHTKRPAPTAPVLELALEITNRSPAPQCCNVSLTLVTLFLAPWYSVCCSLVFLEHHTFQGCPIGLLSFHCNLFCHQEVVIVSVIFVVISAFMNTQHDKCDFILNDQILEGKLPEPNFCFHLVHTNTSTHNCKAIQQNF